MIWPVAFGLIASHSIVAAIFFRAGKVYTLNVVRILAEQRRAEIAKQNESFAFKRNPQPIPQDRTRQ